MSFEKRNNFRRFNPLLNEWVIVAANRINRPWCGAQTKSDDDKARFQHQDSINPLAPKGVRSSGQITPEYTSTYVFDNDFSSFTEYAEDSETVDEPLFKQMPIRGVCRVISYHPDSSKSFGNLTEAEILDVIKVWLTQFNELKSKYEWIQIFENRGAAVGCSNAHPHGQLWAGNFLPNIPQKKDTNQKNYYESTGRVMLVDYLTEEKKKKERIVLENEHWTVVVPYWAFWPFETILLPNRHIRRMDEITEAEEKTLAAIMKQLVIKYDNIFKCYFPYSMGWLGAPTGETQASDHWQLHASFHPPLLRSSSVPKYLAGYEMFSECQRDMTPEQAADILRNQAGVHFSKSSQE
ncbi:unnamed protein product [Auanema sp. JU1783]|nr:unnamed protein product [Auanema sp. JU1783]